MSGRSNRWVELLAVLFALMVVPLAHAVTGEDMAAQTRKAAVGQPAPLSVLDTVDGKRIDLADLYGHQPIYLKFWATWCVPCREQMPHFQQSAARYDKSVAVIAVNLGLNDDVADVREYLKQVKLAMPVAIDSAGELAASFGVVVTPMHVLIDADGRIAYVGHEANAELDGALEKLSHSKPRVDASSVARRRVDERGWAKVGDKAPATGIAPDAKDKPTVIAFVMSWCESYLKESRPAVSQACTKNREAISRAYAAAPSQANWVAIAGRVWSTEDDLAGYRKKYGIQHRVELDSTGEIFRRYRVHEVPTVVIVGSDGVIRERFDGFSPELEAALRTLAGKTS